MKTINLSKLKIPLILFSPLLFVFISARVVLAQDQIEFIKSAPVTNEEFSNAIENFNKRYRLDRDAPNKGLEKSDYIKVEIDDALRNVLTGQTDSVGNGLVFHYLFDALSEELSYAISAGIQEENLSFHPKEFDKDENGIAFKHYFKIMNDGTLQEQEVEGSLNLKDEYEIYGNFVKRKSWIPLILRKVKNIKKHPRMIFHQGKELNAFIVQWESDFPDDQLYLYIYNGVEKTDKRKLRDGATGKERKKLRPFQVPIMRIGNEATIFDIDNTKYDQSENLANESYMEYTEKSLTRYRRKAFDAGHVCPPHCRSSVYTR
jgi:hypothetical protein